FLIPFCVFCLPGVIGRGRGLCPTHAFGRGRGLCPTVFLPSVFCLLSPDFFSFLFPLPFSLVFSSWFPGFLVSCWNAFLPFAFRLSPSLSSNRRSLRASVRGAAGWRVSRLCRVRTTSRKAEG